MPLSPPRSNHVSPVLSLWVRGNTLLLTAFVSAPSDPSLLHWASLWNACLYPILPRWHDRRTPWQRTVTAALPWTWHKDILSTGVFLYCSGGTPILQWRMASSTLGGTSLLVPHWLSLVAELRIHAELWRTGHLHCSMWQSWCISLPMIQSWWLEEHYPPNLLCMGPGAGMVAGTQSLSREWLSTPSFTLFSSIIEFNYPWPGWPHIPLGREPRFVRGRGKGNNSAWDIPKKRFSLFIYFSQAAQIYLLLI